MTEPTAPSTEYQRFTTTPLRWYEWLPLPGLLAFAMYLCRGQAEILLRQLQQPDTQSYGLSTIGGGLQNQVSAARAAIRLWKGGGTAHIAAVFVAADSLFTLIGFAAFGALLWTAMRRSLKIAGRYPWPDDRPFRWYRWPLWGAQDKGFGRLRPLSTYLALGALLVIARLLAFATDGNAALIWAAWIFQKLQWATLAITLLVLVAAIRDAISEPKPAEDDKPPDEDHGRRIRPEVRASWDRYWLAVLVLRGQVGLAVLWSLLVIVDATGQVSDLLRGWMDRWFGFAVGLASVLLFAMLLWSSCRRIILSEAQVRLPESADRATRVLLWVSAVAAVVSIALAFVFRSAVPLCLFAPFAVLLVFELARWTTQWQAFESLDKNAAAKTRAAAHAPRDGQRLAYLRIGRLVAAWVLAALGLALTRAGAGPLILFLLDHRASYFWAGLLMIIGLLLMIVATTWLLRALATLDGEKVPKERELRHLMMVAAAAAPCVAFALWPLTLPPLVGSIAVVAVSFALLAALFAELQRLSELSVPPLGMTMLGLRRVPVFTLLAITLIASALLPDGGYHQIRTTDAMPRRVQLTSVWNQWREANCVDTATAPVPLVIMIAEGGGIRAAYWTASVLTSLQDQPAAACPSRTSLSHVFGISGISGGSVGTAAYLAERPDPSSDWYDAALGKPDFASTALAGAFVRDLPRGVIGFAATDRAGLLETAWERKVPGLGTDYFTKLKPGLDAAARQWTPVTLFNGSQVETGCRVNTSALMLTSVPSLSDCRDRDHRSATVTLAAEEGAETRVPAASVTLDTATRAASCGQSFRASTAALLSARWPFISPSGQLPCKGPRVSVVDGGYADGAGTQGVIELWEQLEPLVAAYNAQSANAAHPVVPTLVVVDNHYQSASAAARVPRTAEALVPLDAYRRAHGTRDTDRWQQAISDFATVPGRPGIACVNPAAFAGRVLLAPTTRPGLPAPLAWTLSAASRQDLTDQRKDLFAEPSDVGSRLLEVLSGRTALTCG
jgi:hypothetical protein